jgi:very-short-patch-repair endonuclease
MRELNKRPDVQAKRAAFLASDRAPFKQPDVHRRSVESQRVIGFPNLRYDGGPTATQRMLFNRLSGATMEFAFTENGKLCIDIAIPFLKLAIEVDGLSHTKRRQKEKDAKKEQLLKERGWTLLRFRNAEILGNLSSVLARIQTVMATLQEAG